MPNSNLTVIPRWTGADDQMPCWAPNRTETGKKLKPVIRCKCGSWVGIKLHHVHKDGTVTASFFHSTARTFTHKGKTYNHPPGCGWHVWLKLSDYDQGEFPEQL